MTIRPPSHGNSGAEGMDLELVTTHEVRSVFTNKAFLDPCRLQYGYMHLDADGDIYPIFCSQPEANVSSARWARGYFSVQLDHDDPYDRVPVGDIHARVGVEPPVWAEVALFHQWMPCGVMK